MPVVTDESEASEIKREQRSERFKAVLKKNGIAEHGAQTAIAKEVGVSDATVAAWMRGSMPRDPEVLFRFCDHYDVDPYWWTSGIARPRDKIDASKLIASAHKVERCVTGYELEVSPEQKQLLVAGVYDDPATADKYLEEKIPFFLSRGEHDYLAAS